MAAESRLNACRDPKGSLFQFEAGKRKKNRDRSEKTEHVQQMKGMNC